MQNLPTAETYEAEVKYMPWGILTAEIEKVIVEKVPQNGVVADLLCGTGYLLGQLKAKRPDIQFIGVDLEQEYIEYAKKQFSNIGFVVADAFEWISDKKFDSVLVTGGLHHLPYDKQEPFLKKVSTLINDGGFALIADPYIPNYSNEQERKLAAAKLGYEYLAATIKNGATDDVARATADLIQNDVFLTEFKTSIEKIQPKFERSFKKVEMHKTWGGEGYGDYYFICQ